MTGQMMTAHAPRPTVRYRADGPPPLGDCPLTFTPTAPDRRWGRILRATRATPIRTSLLIRIVGRREGDRRARKQDEFKTLRSISSLIRCGLLTHTGDGLIATRDGLDILAQAERDAGWPVTTTPEIEGRPA